MSDQSNPNLTKALEAFLDCVRESDNPELYVTIADTIMKIHSLWMSIFVKSMKDPKKFGDFGIALIADKFYVALEQAVEREKLAFMEKYAPSIKLQEDGRIFGTEEDAVANFNVAPNAKPN